MNRLNWNISAEIIEWFNMPSDALWKFENKLIVDVDRMIESHSSLGGDGQGRRALGHLTRGGVFILCAAWELYIEDCLIEVSGHLRDRANSPEDLPLEVQKGLSSYVRGHKHDLKPLELAGDGWQVVYSSYVSENVKSFNTPKAGPIDQIYSKLVGWDAVSGNWSKGRDFVNDFVSIRGEIAHRGVDAGYISLNDLCWYRNDIGRIAVDHDNSASDFISKSSKGNRPWRRRSI